MKSDMLTAQRVTELKRMALEGTFALAVTEDEGIALCRMAEELISLKDGSEFRRRRQEQIDAARKHRGRGEWAEEI